MPMEESVKLEIRAGNPTAPHPLHKTLSVMCVGVYSLVETHD